jgi:ribosome-associated protein
MLEISPALRIRDDEIRIEFVQASGPGGQNVNKTATAAQLRFDVTASPSLPEEVKRRLMKLAGRRVTAEGILIIEARRFRTQEANRADALKRLMALLQKAAEKPRPRRPTKPTPASKEARLRRKKRRSEIKKSRREDSEI